MPLVVDWRGSGRSSSFVGVVKGALLLLLKRALQVTNTLIFDNDSPGVLLLYGVESSDVVLELGDQVGVLMFLYSLLQFRDPFLVR